MPNNKKKDGLIMQAGILAVAGIIVRIIGLLYNTPLTNIIGDEGFGYYSNAYTAYSIVLLISSYSIPSAVSKVIAQKLAKREYRECTPDFSVCIDLCAGSRWNCQLICVFLCIIYGRPRGLGTASPDSGTNHILQRYPWRIPRIFPGTQIHGSDLRFADLEQIVNAGVSVLMAYLLVRMVKGESETTQASFGAAGRHDWYGGRGRFRFTFYDGRVCAQ